MKKNHFIQMISGLLAILLLFNCFIVQAESAKNQFSDVKETAWYYSAVEYAVKNGLMNGVGNGKFSPGGAASRAMLVTLLYRMEGEPKVSGETPFTDLNSKWYQDSICWAYQNKIVNGITETTYKPSAELTRQQFATILYRYAKDYLGLNTASEAKLSDFPDSNSVSAYAKEAMSWAYGEELITGSKKGNRAYLAPKGNATRAQMAIIFQRFDQFLTEERAEQPAPEQPQPEQPQPEQPTTHTCDFSGIPTYKEGEDKHIYRCKVEGCDKKREVSCTFSEQKIPATCTEQGKIIFTCGSCGYNQTVNDPAAPAGHSWKRARHLPETQGEDSKHIITCSRPNCKESYEEACTVTKTTLESGTIKYSCSVCDYSEDIYPDPEDENSGYHKVISYNLKAMYYDYKTGDTADQREGVVEYLRSHNAALIGLQEIDNNNPRSFSYDQMKYLGEQLGYDYYFCDVMDYPAQGYQYGTGFLSKYPIKDVTKVYYNVQDPNTSEKRAYSRAVIEFPEGDLVFYNTHLCTASAQDPTKESAQQFNELMRAIYSETLPTVLTGDFNLLYEVRSELIDTSRIVPLNGGKDLIFFNGQLPIDDIYVRNMEYYADPNNQMSIFHDVHDIAPYSDHMPCWGYFKFKNNDQSGTKIKILNQNIRYDAGSDRGTSNDPRVRRYRFKALVEKYDPDIICLQEADPFWIAALPQDLGATYDMYYHYRQPVSGSDEACPILWKKDQYEKLAEGNFWLSDTPNQSSASFVPNYYPRVVNWVKLKDKSSGSIFVVHSTHLGFDYTAEHINKIRQLFVNSFQTHSDAYNILMGDFNISYGSDYYNIIVNETDLVDLRPIAIQMQANGHCTLGDLRNGTYNGFNSPNGSSWIDFILAPPRNDVAIDYYGVCYDQIAVPNQNIAEGYVSDHFAVLTEIRIGTEVSYEQYWNPKT